MTDTTNIDDLDLQNLTEVASSSDAADANSPISDDNSQIQQLQSQIDSTKKDLNQKTMDYMNLYRDYKILEKRKEDRQSNEKKDKLFSAIKEFSGVINILHNFLSTANSDLLQNESVKGLIITYDSYIKSLNSKNIYIVDSLWQSPNEMHDVIAMQEASDLEKQTLQARWIDISNLSGKIINQFEIWFYYQEWSSKEVIKSAKVIVSP